MLAFYHLEAGYINDIIKHKNSLDSDYFNTYIYRGYSNFLLNMAFISSSEVENIYIS